MLITTNKICTCTLSAVADPNYKAVFSGSASQSLPKSKSKTATAKKFDSAHKKNFSRYVNM